MNPPPPELDEDIKRLARVYARDTDPAGEVIAALLVHITAQEVHAKTLQALASRPESHALEAVRQASVCATPLEVAS